MEGETKVPERESIESFAAHHASMAIYLSTGMLGELGRRLIAGGYGKDTPAAIVYKATWPEEEAYLCTVEQLEETAKAHDITKNSADHRGRYCGTSELWEIQTVCAGF